MIAYLINITLCALLLLAIYALLLERENRHCFKRIYLLVSLVFSMLVPIIVLEIDASRMPANMEMLYVAQPFETKINGESWHYIAETTEKPEIGPFVPPVHYSRMLLIIYLTITSLFLFRLFRNCRQMFIYARKNDSLYYRGTKVVLVDEKVTPYSFGHYIFINREDYYSGRIPDEILLHERAHVRQLHTCDILFIELLIAFGWFNPVFYLYRNKIKQNHEFLADAAVVGRNSAIIPAYLSILINHIPQYRKISFTSYFNYLITKKRLVMITKTTSKKRAWCSSLALIPVFMAAVFVFSTKTIAQHALPEQPNGSIEIPNQEASRTDTPVSSEENEPMNLREGSYEVTEIRQPPQDNKLADLLKDSLFAARHKEYNQIIEKYITEKDGRKIINMGGFTKEDLEKMFTLFQSMTPEQQSVQTFVAQRRKWVDEKIPTKEQFESWKVPSEYGVWLDGKRIENSELNRYQPSDFSYYSASRLARNAKNYGLHVYQLELYSTAYYKKIKAEWEADETLYLLPNSQRSQSQ